MRSSALAITGNLAVVLYLAFSAPLFADTGGTPYRLEVSPAEHETIIDPQTGAELTFLTTHSAADTNLYFHERSWLPDGSVIIFNSSRENGGLMGYLTGTGELIRIAGPAGGVGAATAAVDRNSVYGRRGDDVLEVRLDVHLSDSPADDPSEVMAVERVIASLPKGAHGTSLNPSCDGKHLALGIQGGDEDLPPTIVTINIKSGKVKRVYTVPGTLGYGGHVQWSHTNPFLLSFAGRPQRLWVVDTRDGSARNVYEQLEGELVTHEHWWGQDQLVFCGGLHPKPTEDAHVKVVNIRTGMVRIIGPGSWWPDATPKTISKRNYWHCSGSDDCRWVAADNWHGDITLFEGKTCRPHILTCGHRTYGSGQHPHVGWDPTGCQVIFTSHMLGNPNVCVATIPQGWQEANKTPRLDANEPGARAKPWRRWLRPKAK